MNETAMKRRELTSAETRLIAKLLEGSISGVEDLRDQIPHLKVMGDNRTMLDFVIEEEVVRASVPDGPLPVIGLVRDRGGVHQGELLVWVEGGRLSMLEYAWVTDAEPAGLPDAEEVTVQTTDLHG